jgi:hypothetical protein
MGVPVAETEHDLHELHKDLTRALSDQHARVVALGPGDAVTDDAFDALVEHAKTLLAFEHQLPTRLAEPKRLRSQKVIFWSWRVQSGVTAALIACVFLLGHTAWWLVLILPHLLATLAGWSLKATPQGAPGPAQCRDRAAPGGRAARPGGPAGRVRLVHHRCPGRLGLRRHRFHRRAGGQEVTDDLEYRLQATDRRIRDLDSRLDDLDSDHQSLKTRFGYTDDLDYELRRIRSDVSECESTVERLDGKVDEIESDLGARVEAAQQAVKLLTQHVRLLEGQIMAAGGAPAADLDTFTTDQRALARTMQHGWNAADALLSNYSRSHHQGRVERFHNARTRHQAARKGGHRTGRRADEPPLRDRRPHPGGHPAAQRPRERDHAAPQRGHAGRRRAGIR